MTATAPAPLVMCNWSNHGRFEKRMQNIRILPSLKTAFERRFGTRFMTFAINSMMQYYIENKDQFVIDINKYWEAYQTKPIHVDVGIIETLTMKQTHIGDWVPFNQESYQIWGVHYGFIVASKLQKEFIEVYSSLHHENRINMPIYDSGDHPLHSLDCSFVIYNFLIMMAMETIKIK